MGKTEWIWAFLIYHCLAVGRVCHVWRLKKTHNQHSLAFSLAHHHHLVSSLLFLNLCLSLVLCSLHLPSIASESSIDHTTEGWHVASSFWFKWIVQCWYCFTCCCYNECCKVWEHHVAYSMLLDLQFLSVGICASSLCMTWSHEFFAMSIAWVSSHFGILLPTICLTSSRQQRLKKTQEGWKLSWWRIYSSYNSK